MKVFSLIIPFLFLVSFAYALYKKVPLFESFSAGIKGAIPLVVSVFPYICTVAILSKLFEASGLENQLFSLLSPLFSFLGIPTEITPLLIIKPLSGGGAIHTLSEILEVYGVDSYIARCACVAYGSAETIFYIGGVYFASIKRKKLTLALAIALLSYFLSVILACFLCKIM